MAPLFFTPHPALQHCISHFMIVEVKAESNIVRFSPFPPTPQHAIHFYPRDSVITRDNKGVLHKLPSCVIIGPQVSQVDIAIGMHHIIVSVAFQPGGLHRLLGIPMNELYDKPVDATLLLGPELFNVQDQLNEELAPIAMKTVVENFLLKKLHYSKLLPWELAMREQLQSGSSIESAASLSCLSLRQYERRSKEIMGYSPKVFAKLIRFSNAYRLKERNPKLSWTAVAHTSGYYDQMHMIRDFKAFTNILPSQLTKQILLAPALLQEHLRI
jgi:AraC-like DNA-binding protein